VSQSIIQTAVANKTLHLELDYRQPSMLLEGDTRAEKPTTATELTFQHDDPPVSDEFACLLKMI
jgi:hypothetical protein